MVPGFFVPQVWQPFFAPMRLISALSAAVKFRAVDRAGIDSPAYGPSLNGFRGSAAALIAATPGPSNPAAPAAVCLGECRVRGRRPPRRLSDVAVRNPSALGIEQAQGPRVD